MEAIKVDAIMDQMDELDVNINRSKININHFAPLFKSDSKEGTKHRKKPKTKSVSSSDDGEERKNK